MILGLGLDLVSVERIRAWTEVPGLVERFFHPREAEESRARGEGAAASLAARFAAKEAFGKALGSGLEGLRLRDIQVVNDRRGRPDIVLHGGALERFRGSGGSSVLVSLTHEGGLAAAVVVIEG